MRNLPENLFVQLYGSDPSELKAQKERYTNLILSYAKRYNTDAESNSIRLFSSPGRSEISGNHTDHNLGKVLAASIQLDCIGAVETTNTDIITIYDLTYNEDYHININETQRVSGENGSIALVRGLLQAFKNKGYKIGGFNSCFSSSVIAAAGVSSSASFEMMICIIISNLFNKGTIPVNEFASMGQFAENNYWDKSSGLLDQMACAFGGLISIDFANPASPLVEKIPFDFSKENYNLMIVNTGKGHADLSKEYSSVPEEMKSVAKFFGKETLRGLSAADVTNNLSAIREKCGDRAVMRAYHFFAENDKVEAEVIALKQNKFQDFLQLVTASGNSSWKWLQNVYVPNNPAEQPISISLALTEQFIAEKGAGACRIHGGGFAGVIMALLPHSLAPEYTNYMNKALGFTPSVSQGKSPVYQMSIRPFGSIEIK